ncbi:hypothetical protein B0H14DRAFT_3127155 [Mycena olivaceomarginata]|nr:hypothetical protein B0H14DRAFT_3127155 [Mycena olivaceomarginata]
MRSASLLTRLATWELFDKRKPGSLPKAESLATIKWVAEAQREFLRMAEVTDKISEYKTCFWDTVLRELGVAGGAASGSALRSSGCDRGRARRTELSSLQASLHSISISQTSVTPMPVIFKIQIRISPVESVSRSCSGVWSVGSESVMDYSLCAKLPPSSLNDAVTFACVVSPGGARILRLWDSFDSLLLDSLPSGFLEFRRLPAAHLKILETIVMHSANLTTSSLLHESQEAPVYSSYHFSLALSSLIPLRGPPFPALNVSPHLSPNRGFQLRVMLRRDPLLSRFKPRSALRDVTKILLIQGFLRVLWAKA